MSSRLELVDDTELGKLGEARWRDTRTRIGELVSSLLSLPNVGVSECTKILHLKRPHLVPILDSYVVKFLTSNDLDSNSFSAEELVQICLGAMDMVRADLGRNEPSMSELQAGLADLPVLLTKVRLHGILCWTQEKWVNRGDRACPYGIAGRSLSQALSQVALASGSIPEAGDSEPTGEIRTIKEFRQVKLRAEGVIVTTGSKPPKAHRALCRELSEERFTEAVVFNDGKKGRYYQRRDLAEAVRDFHAAACMKCKPERPIVR